MIDLSAYLSRITSEHKTIPRFMSLVEARLKIFADLYDCFGTFDAAFDLDAAVGGQLDIIGEYVGVKRLLTFQPKSASALLPDVYYRLLIKARISLNKWDGTTDGIRKIWNEVFPDYSITIADNQDMSLVVRIYGFRSLLEMEIIQYGYIAPKPMGVRIAYLFIVSDSFTTNEYTAAAASEVVKEAIAAADGD
jgi:hypothetical protein